MHCSINCPHFHDIPGGIYCSKNGCPYKAEFREVKNAIYEERHQKRVQKELLRKQELISRLQPFLRAHGTAETDVEAFLDYAAAKLHFINNLPEWIIEKDTISLHREWENVSFFDDGGGEQGSIDWSMTAVEITANLPAENEKLDDRKPYKTASPAVTDCFRVRDPFGLKGLFEIRYRGFEEDID